MYLVIYSFSLYSTEILFAATPGVAPWASQLAWFMTRAWPASPWYPDQHGLIRQSNMVSFNAQPIHPSVEWTENITNAFLPLAP